jgi:hypothetical protein
VYEPMFTFLLGALYDPLPLLVVLADINRASSRCSRGAPEPAKETDRVSLRKSSMFMSATLIEYYSDEQPAHDHACNAASEAESHPPAAAVQVKC